MKSANHRIEKQRKKKQHMKMTTMRQLKFLHSFFACNTHTHTHIIHNRFGFSMVSNVVIQMKWNEHYTKLHLPLYSRVKHMIKYLQNYSAYNFISILCGSLRLDYDFECLNWKKETNHCRCVPFTHAQNCASKQERSRNAAPNWIIIFDLVQHEIV